ncbi:FAS1-like dehydratase domain-containing protein [Bacillus solitudinis]|uniref:FAS1-like dehydratase domain-containing protein n=1 Tax=Bacillus solitudinis TaxID=2014074 RepID=UPI0012FD1203|nr:MaoC family dehydratase N-terminal domain-containing protein [Bacillus solitudinis]
MELLVGLKTEEIEVTVTEEMIQTYLKAIGEISSIGEGEAPITFLMTFWQKIKIPWLQCYEGFIHGEQMFELREPICAGSSYLCSISLTKRTRKRNLEFLVHTLTISNEGKLIGKATSTLIRKIA